MELHLRADPLLGVFFAHLVTFHEALELVLLRAGNHDERVAEVLQEVRLKQQRRIQYNETPALDQAVVHELLEHLPDDVFLMA